MVKLDITKAAFSGFGVIGRNPLAVVAWALFLGVVGFLPALGMMGTIFSVIAQLVAADKAGVDPTPEMVMPMVGSMIGLIPVLMLTGLVVRMVLTGAIFRAVLFPKDSGWFYLRLGARELWLALLFIVVGIITFVIMMAAMAVVMPLAFVALGQEGDSMVKMMVIRLAMLPVYGVLLFLAVRFCLAFPMTFAESKFRLMESWAMTRGNSWRILLVILLLIALAIVAEIIVICVVIFAVLGVVGVGAAGGVFDEARLEAFFNQDPSVWMQSLWPWIAGLGVVGCLVGTLVMVIFTAPWADIYRQLRETPDALV